MVWLARIMELGRKKKLVLEVTVYEYNGVCEIKSTTCKEEAIKW